MRNKDVIAPKVSSECYNVCFTSRLFSCPCIHCALFLLKGLLSLQRLKAQMPRDLGLVQYSDAVHPHSSSFSYATRKLKLNSL